MAQSAGEAEAFYAVDPYLIELGWRAWDCMGEENILGRMGFPDHLVNFLEVSRARDAGHATAAYITRRFRRY